METEQHIEEMLVDAIKAKNAKKILQQRETFILARQRRTIFFRSLSGIAAAACLLFGIIHFKGISDYKSYGSQYYAALTLPEPRGENEADSLLMVAYEQIGNAKYEIAHRNIDAVILLLQKEQFDHSTEEGQYFHQLNKAKLDDAEWLKTITYMKQGKRKKAKELLQNIASGTGIYQTEAKKILR
ncbi:MAG: hypothetical protein FWH59_02165 [Lentimicrobiaceae bacterium]|nr:hypothetical protein [Lentimicrobiaceae bacterium]